MRYGQETPAITGHVQNGPVHREKRKRMTQLRNSASTALPPEETVVDKHEAHPRDKADRRSLHTMAIESGVQGRPESASFEILND